MTAVNQKTLIFLHIPKAAGSTLQSILLKLYDPGDLCLIYGKKGTRGMEEIEKIKDYPEPERMRIRVLVGHMKFGLHSYLRQPATYITFMREPVARIISHYFYTLNYPGHYLYDRVMENRMDLKDYVESGLSDELDNGQTRLLSGIGQSVAFGGCTPEMLETAKKNIREHFSMVGLSERFDETLLLMKNMFGWKTPYYQKINVGRQKMPREKISEDTLAAIRKYNEWDIRLYAYAKERFAEVLAGQPPSFRKELRNFQRWNGYYGRYCSLKRLMRSQGKKIIKRSKSRGDG